MKELKEEFEEKFTVTRNYKSVKIKTTDFKKIVESKDVWEWIDEKLKETEKFYREVDIGRAAEMFENLRGTYDKAIYDAEKVCGEIEDRHPYKQVGNVDSYSQYNEGWSDACDIIASEIEQLKDQK